MKSGIAYLDMLARRIVNARQHPASNESHRFNETVFVPESESERSASRSERAPAPDLDANRDAILSWLGLSQTPAKA
ncbi:hypothetical protein [Candidatus Binatus sp.]|uniref:hypothetical protein n=1 Tax=Candidatus Binatus sp. TaxID=2811406 RepID=UPI003C9824C1